MRGSELGHLAPYSLPPLVVLGDMLGGFWFLTVPVFVFGVIPILDALIGEAPQEEESASDSEHHRH